MSFNKRQLAIAVFIAGLSFQACNEEKRTDEKVEKETTITAVEMTPAIPYQIVNEFPHDKAAFTEGLQYVDGSLYESTGEYGSSDIRKTELKTGKVLQSQKLDDKYFGEGLTVLNGKIYQLTYKEKTGFVYNQATLKQLQTFTFDTGEGWGMTNDGANIIYSDGTSKLYFLDPATLKEVKRIDVNDSYGSVTYINELEYIKGYIYANQWQTDFIYKIDPASGKVVGKADLRNLRERTGIPALGAGGEDGPEVMNGIAYDAAGNRIFITGKYWPKLFEIKLDN
ncbi:MAG: glutaminyl-peptide cyclotransferase [Sphingobacteriales bacterium]|nr:MAG: glutaminyl-peptide cyclotransferase [Sphingobacteriales bacterium]